MSEEMKVLGIRVPETLKERLEGLAKQNGRSLSGEALYRLRKSVELETRDGQKQQA